MNDICCLGYSYTDIYPNFTKKGGIHNFSAQEYCQIGEAECHYNGNFVKTYEKVGPPDYTKIAQIKSKTLHLMYGELINPEIFSKYDNFAYLSVDFISKFSNLDKSLLFRWSKIANILFCSINEGELYNNWPKLGCELVLHSKEGVLYISGGKSLIVKNPRVGDFPNTISAGDFLTAILIETPITQTSILRAMYKTYDYLEELNNVEV